ncbi:hypothetical protein VTN77DRAFT_6121 [Rasamsonia byssochlamydoides]|uniref:uncharacterized protein n=1 Tax=Rasamsonia byssochlamydoides TaxID=89139 RepID=UPI0037425E0C
MGLVELFSDMISSLGFAEAQAEAPPAEDTDSTSAEAEQEEKPTSEEAESEGGDSEEPEQEEEEEQPEEEEAEDPKPKLEEECINSAQCAPVKHHFDECVERVTRQQEDPDYKGPKEDCVEEFFHLQHCATQCAAPKLWKILK